MTPNFQQPSWQPKDTPVIHPLAPVMREWVQETLWNVSVSRPRSRQSAIGLSEIGQPCPRRLAYHAANTPRVALSDPLRAEVGTAVHAYLADAMRELDAGSGRYVVETTVVLEGVPGTCDLLDRKRHMVIDWKSTTSHSRKMRANGAPSVQEWVQVGAYGMAMRLRGEVVTHVALAVIPVDLELKDIRVFVRDLDADLEAMVRERLDRLGGLRGVDPAAVVPMPTTLCGWCPWHMPGSTDARVACCGQESEPTKGS